MNHLRDLIRTILLEPWTTERRIAQRMRVSKGTVHRYRRLAREGGMAWEQLEPMSLLELDAQFNKRTRRIEKQPLNFKLMDEERKNPIVTRYQLWKEYRREHRQAGYSYSRFAHLYRNYLGTQKTEMRQTYRPGGVLYVDYSGEKPTYIDRATGHRVQAELFVGVLAASNYTFACVTRTQSVVDWIHAHRQMYAYFNGATQTITPDNLKSGVNKTRFQGLVLQKDFQLMAEHYGTAALPARPYAARDKGKVEGAVKICQHSILAPDRHTLFASFEDLENALAERLEAFNTRPHSDAPDSRRERFLQSDAHALLPLPEQPFTYSTLREIQKVPINYHPKVDEHAYSVPHRFIGAKVQVSIEPDTVTFYSQRMEIARHARSAVKGGTTTAPEHQTPHHLAQSQRNRDGFTNWAKSVGPNMLAVLEAQFLGPVALQGLAACDDLKNLSRHYSLPELERACAEAVALGVLNVSGVQRFLYAPRDTPHREPGALARIVVDNWARQVPKPHQTACPMAQ